MIIPGAVHVDLYDKLDVIPFDKLEIILQSEFKIENYETVIYNFLYGITFNVMQYKRQ